MSRRVAKILAFTGAFGSGKSNFASWLGVNLADTYKSPLWANYSLAGSIPLRSVPQLYECGYPAGPWGVIVLDELHDTIDSRASSSMANKPFLEWFMQSRKQQSDILIMTQVLDQIDKRVRRMLAAEFCFKDIDGTNSQMDTYKIDLNGMRDGKISSRVWHRPLAYGLYDHLERAWPLDNVVAKAQPATTVKASPVRSYSR